MILSRWITRQHISRAEFARRIGSQPPYITMLCQHRVWPSKDMAVRIMKATAGQVTPNDMIGIDVKTFKEAKRG